MNPQDPGQYPSPQDYQSNLPNPPVSNHLTVTQPGEVTLAEIKRHPIGIITIYIAAGLVLTIIAVLAFGAVPHLVDPSTRNQFTAIGAGVFLVFAVVTAIYTLISTHVYWGNSWVVTSDSITQVSQNSLFNRQSSQLALENIEDVTSEQNGILTHIFNYGVLKVETAGHRAKFVFPYCPNPNIYATRILQAREAWDQRQRQEGSAQTPTAEQPPAPQPYTGY